MKTLIKYLEKNDITPIEALCRYLIVFWFVEWWAYLFPSKISFIIGMFFMLVTTPGALLFSIELSKHEREKCRRHE